MHIPTRLLVPYIFYVLQYFFLDRYVYTNNTIIHGETVLMCLHAGKKYCIKGLEDLCTQFLDSSVSVENVCTIFEQARFFELSDLVPKCKTIMKKNELEVVGNDF